MNLHLCWDSASRLTCFLRVSTSRSTQERPPRQQSGCKHHHTGLLTKLPSSGTIAVGLDQKDGDDNASRSRVWKPASASYLKTQDEREREVSEMEIALTSVSLYLRWILHYDAPTWNALVCRPSGKNDCGLCSVLLSVSLILKRAMIGVPPGSSYLQLSFAKEASMYLHEVDLKWSMETHKLPLLAKVGYDSALWTSLSSAVAVWLSSLS